MGIVPRDHSLGQAVEAAKGETHSRQAHRLVDYLVEHGPTSTGELCQQCAIGNLSSAANYIRPALHRRGVALICTLPIPTPRNRFGEPSQAHIWRLSGPVERPEIKAVSEHGPEKCSPILGQSGPS